MVRRPLSTDTTSEDAGVSRPLERDAADEEKRLAEKFAPYRRLVPLVFQNEDVIFLNAASAPPSNLIVHEAITRYSSEALYSPYPYTKWRETREEARRLIARCINAEDPDTIAFTRDTTEGLGSFIRCVPFAPGDNVVLVDTEHPNQAYCWLALRPAGLEVRQVPTIAGAQRAGRIEAVTADALRPYVDARTRAVGLSSATFDAGQLHDVAGICGAFRPRGIHVLADMTQHVGFARADVRALGVSAAAFSLHKGLNAPTGAGALYVSPAALAALGDPVPPIVSMEAVANMAEDLLVRADDPLEMHKSARRFEHANMSLVAVAAAEAFARFYLDVLGPADVEAYLYGLTDRLRAECERLGVRVLGPEDRGARAPHICVLDLPKEWGPYLRGSGGARVTLNRLGVRVSFGFYSSEEDVRRFVRVLELGVAEGLRI